MCHNRRLHNRPSSHLWHNRAVWYVQELLHTFGIAEQFVAKISLCPKNDATQTEEYFFVGFPGSKFVKVLVRDYLFPDEKLGHVDGHSRLVDSHGEDERTDCVPCSE
ncbi:hypothetical protein METBISCDRAFT_28253 [Metschnikowia bicuspidata]|uniref:Uncharacterized protein n=1 Tax=Metschnikowia bicuspidata TaxID=27322 RepID=A0A4P9ZC57_9ASCO|nr:hypothetical protein METBISCDRAFT_28253 [Metschnikowia bicuspidata]